MKTSILLLKISFVLSLLTFALMSVDSPAASQKKSSTEVILKPMAEYVLGEYYQSGFKVSLKNTSNVDLEVLAVDKKRSLVKSGFILKPGGAASISIDRNEKFVLQNQSEHTASLFIQVNKPVGRFKYQWMYFY